MPTGYTAKLYEGEEQSFNEFVLECSRAFGAMISLRDDPRAEIPAELEVDSFYFTQVEKAQKELEQLQNASDAELMVQAKSERQYDLSRQYENAVRTEAARQGYTDMLAKVQAWTPPTDEHVNIKAFMVEQLESSLRSDCRNEPVDLEELRSLVNRPVEDSDIDIEKFRAEGLNIAERRLSYAVKNLADQQNSIADKNRWIKALRDSLTASSES